ncbi:MAG: PDZ domain-containing protein [Gemmatales bacterium]
MQHRILTCLLFAFFPSLQAEDPPSKAQESYLVPYRLSDIKHVVVRVKVDGKGPFNFIVDTGAPAVYFGNEIARKLGKEVKEEGYWETFDKVEIEGGVKLKGIKARVEEPFQLVGINKMNAAGVRYHGVLGYAVLAQYQIEYDFTQPHLKWTKLDWTPPPPIALGSLSEGATKNMKAMIGLSSLATSLMPKKEDAKIIYRGFIGIEVSETDGKITVSKVLGNTPASGKLHVGDIIVSIDGKEAKTLAAMQKQVSAIGIDKEVNLEVQRENGHQSITLKTVKGF